MELKHLHKIAVMIKENMNLRANMMNIRLKAINHLLTMNHVKNLQFYLIEKELLEGDKEPQIIRIMRILNHLINILKFSAQIQEMKIKLLVLLFNLLSFQANIIF